MENIQLSILESVYRVEFETLNSYECNLALVTLMGYHYKNDGSYIYILDNEKWIIYDPMHNWEQFGEIVTNQHLVVASHPSYDNDSKDGKKAFWYSCHAFYSDTEANGWDYRKVVAQSCLKLLKKIHPNLLK